MDIVNWRRGDDCPGIKEGASYIWSNATDVYQSRECQNRKVRVGMSEWQHFSIIAAFGHQQWNCTPTIKKIVVPFLCATSKYTDGSCLDFSTDPSNISFVSSVRCLTGGGEIRRIFVLAPSGSVWTRVNPSNARPCFSNFLSKFEEMDWSSSHTFNSFTASCSVQ